VEEIGSNNREKRQRKLIDLTVQRITPQPAAIPTTPGAAQPKPQPNPTLTPADPGQKAKQQQTDPIPGIFNNQGQVKKAQSPFQTKEKDPLVAGRTRERKEIEKRRGYHARAS
jgi:hypothetical protein